MAKVAACIALLLVSSCSFVLGSEDAVPEVSSEHYEGDDGVIEDGEFTDLEADRMTNVTNYFISRFEAEYNRTPTIGVGIGFVHFEMTPESILNSKLIGEEQPAVKCASGKAITMQAVIEGDGPDAEPFFLDVVTSGTEELRVFSDP